MASKLSRKWTSQQIEQMAIEPEIDGASELADELGAVVSGMWNAEKDSDAQNSKAATPTMGQ